MRDEPIYDDAGNVHRVRDRPEPPYLVRVLPGRMYFNREQVDDLLDNVDRVYTQAGCIPRLTAIKAAFTAGYNAGQKARRAKRGRR